MAKLNPILTQIENKYDFDRTTPLFKHHKDNMKYFESDMPKVRQPDAETERQSLDIFKSAITDYKKVGDRKQFIGSILSNYGLGPDSNEKAAE